ncbi:BRO1-like domain-containing protein [Crepidotus variabilis]|uniref:pH-response regulator protein palC n=1 Tax=Crepidotus variabilis TaxID=179855 RepID=A0A9P6EE68_9AGAR|nr:BRO1-like domain-containing protein [Crepidotus variabilis]
MYLYDLPTTGSVSFVDLCIDRSLDKAYTRHISEATQARANLRGVLKDSKRTDHGEKDFLSLVKLIEEYLPYIQSIINCFAHDEIGITGEPTFSWRSTLSANIFNNSPRMDVPGLYADYAFSLLTYGFALCNLAHITVNSVGGYEQNRAITDVERRAKEEKLNVALQFLCRASGVFTYLSETVLPEWETNRGTTPNFQKPPDLSREVSNALAKMSLADAQTIAIRRLLSKSAYDSNVSPGPPLPPSHRPPPLLAKLHLECANYYSSARTLAMSLGSKEVSGNLRKYLSNQATMHSALSHKWLGVDAGEKGGSDKAGDAIAFMQCAKKELEELKDGGKLVSIGSAEKEKEEKWKDRINTELASVSSFLKYYKKMNDTVHFQPVPSQQDVQAKIPNGILAIAAKPYVPPSPAFGPGSIEYTRRKTEQLEIAARSSSDVSDNHGIAPGTMPTSPTASYAGAGAYF